MRSSRRRVPHVPLDRLDQMRRQYGLQENVRETGCEDASLIRPGPARHGKDREIRYQRAQPPGNVETIHVRQLAVQEYDRGWVLRSEPQCRLSILGLEDRISFRSERYAHHLPRRRVVLDDEDGGGCPSLLLVPGLIGHPPTPAGRSYHTGRTAQLPRARPATPFELESTP
jgi:hypothetical protein